MPSTGFYLFLLILFYEWRASKTCVNALNGLLLISSVVPQRDKNVWGIVSMPSTGFYLFLRKVIMTRYFMEAMCQCPQRASTYFFFRTIHQVFEPSVCQCPQRASTYFFSTLPEPLILLSSGEVFCK